MRNMAVKFRLDTLGISELNRLMQLAIEAGLRTHGFSARLLEAYGAFAAECHFEMWSRQRARQNGPRPRRVYSA
jgi:hypothetical protein